MRSTIYFNGKPSADFGLIVEYYPESVHAARRGELIPIPGRNGVIIREDGAYDTYQQTFQIWFRNTLNQDTFQIARDVAEWLLSASGFCRLEDTYEPEYFRMARFVGPLNVETVLRNHGRATLGFDVQPQRYLKSGETPIRFQSTTEGAFTITNPTQFEARPLLKFVDTSEHYQRVPQTLTREYGKAIQSGGYISYSMQDTRYVTAPVDVTGYDYAFITSVGYVFQDANGNAIQYDRQYHKNEQFIIPSGAVTVVLESVSELDNVYPATLELQKKSANPGNAAVTINGTTINIDFSQNDTVFLDCDLHDAYYVDGSSANNAVSFASRFDDYPTFPGLVPGENTVIVRDNENLDFYITPRWWAL